MACMWSDALWSQTIFIFLFKKAKERFRHLIYDVLTYRRVAASLDRNSILKNEEEELWWGGGGKVAVIIYHTIKHISYDLDSSKRCIIYPKANSNSFFFVFLLSQLCIWYVHLRRAYMETLGLLLYSVDVTSGWRERGLLSKEKSTRWGLSFFFSGSLVCVFQEVKCKHARISLEKYKKLIWTQEQQSSSSTDR
jgi:hypothetical protein